MQCFNCQTEFTSDTRRKTTKKFCSKKCKNLFHSRLLHDAHLEEKLCQSCGTKFFQKRINQKFCSLICGYKTRYKRKFTDHKRKIIKKFNLSVKISPPEQICTLCMKGKLTDFGGDKIEFEDKEISYKLHFNCYLQWLALNYKF